MDLSSTSVKSPGEDHYRLGWNSHLPAVNTSFVKYFENQLFTDVTLFCEGGIWINCHKIVLAACSSLLENHFLTTHQHQATAGASKVMINGVKFSELKNILNYMYNGEVVIAGKDLPRFLEVAKKLKLKGLTDNTGFDENEVLDLTMPLFSESPSQKEKDRQTTTPSTSLEVRAKAYKKYEKKAMMSAVQAVRDGIPALAAARTFSVPSRTLYDKLKKAGIPPSKLWCPLSLSNNEGYKSSLKECECDKETYKVNVELEGTPGPKSISSETVPNLDANGTKLYECERIDTESRFLSDVRQESATPVSPLKDPHSNSKGYVTTIHESHANLW